MTIFMPTEMAQPAATTQAKSGALSSDFNTFLRMLTVQMQNQDPLNPMEASDFAVQLATFSGVEQQVKGNQLLEALGVQFTMVAMAQFASWVGQEARVSGENLWFDGTPITLSPNPAKTADRVVLVTRDATGTLLSREDLTISNEPYQWLGADATGNRLPNGHYRLSLENWRDGSLLGEVSMDYYAQVRELRGSPDGTILVLPGDIEVLAAEVTGLRPKPAVSGAANG